MIRPNSEVVGNVVSTEIIILAYSRVTGSVIANDSERSAMTVKECLKKLLRQWWLRLSSYWKVVEFLGELRHIKCVPPGSFYLVIFLILKDSSVKAKVLVACGTRPEIIKMAPVYHALRQSATLEPVLLHTGEHTDLAAPLYDFFKMKPDHTMVLERSNAMLAHLSAIVLEGCSKVIRQEAPKAVLVHGDTTSAAMSALAAFYEQVPIGHVEAGLRTYDNYSPFPEEMNRALIGRMADWHFAPTVSAKESLLRENVKESSIYVTGNTVIDAAHLTTEVLSAGYADAFLEKENLAERVKGKRLVLVTAHRRENWGSGLVAISQAIATMLKEQPDVLVVWPLHANPDVAKVVVDTLDEAGADKSRLILSPPLEYPTLIWMLHNAWVVMTDSGGIQEEAAAFGVPVLVLRDSTERPELISAGGGVLVGANYTNIIDTVTRLTFDPASWESMRNIRNPFGDGTARNRIVRVLKQQLS